MKRRLLAVLLTIALMMTLIPAALAEEAENSDSSVTVEVTGDENTTVDPGEGENTDPSAPAEGEGETTDPVAPTEGEGETTDPAAPTESEGEATDPAAPTTPETPEVPETPETPENPEEPVTPEQPAEEPLTDEQLEEYYQQWLSDPDSGVKGLTDAQMQQLNDYINVKQGEIVISKPEQPVTPAAVPEFDVEAAYAYINTLETYEEISAYLSTLTEEQLTELEAYTAEVEGPFEPAPDFTVAGPIFAEEPVRYSLPKRLMVSRTATTGFEGKTMVEPASGLQVNKTASATDTTDEDGNPIYKIDLTASAESNIVTTSVPCDIVLVLDRSGSMEGKNMTSLISSVNGFLTTVQQNSPDSRVAIVSYADSGASTTIDTGTSYSDALQPITSNNAVNTELTTVVNGLSKRTDGGTYSDEGLEKAAKILQAVPKSDPNYDNKRVVILFTDGIPGDGSWSSLGIYVPAEKVAQNSIHWGVILKAEKGSSVTLDMDQAFYYPNSKSSASTFAGATTGCGATVYSVGLNLPAYAGARSSGSKINEYMYRVSSHRPDGSHVGYSVLNEWEKENSDWNQRYPDNLTRNRPEGSYYPVGDTSALNDIFQSIAQQTGKPIENAVIRDYITPGFDICDANGNVYEVGKTITNGSVTGTVKQDANGVYVKWTEVDLDPGDATGDGAKSFSQSIYLKPKAEFWGGNQVPTNITGISGVYDESGNNIGSFPEPSPVDVPVKKPVVTATTSNIYFGGTTPSVSDLYDFAEPTEAWQTAYVDIDLPKPEDVSVDNTKDGDCIVTVTVSPKNSGTYTAQSTIVTSKVYVFEPEAVFMDSTIYLGNTADYAVNQPASVTWKHGKTVSTDVAMIGEAPDVDYNYDKNADAFTDCRTVQPTPKVTERPCGSANSFTVHVLKPTAAVVLADTTCYFGNTYTPAGGEAVVSWNDSHSDHQNVPAASGREPYENGELKYYADSNKTTTKEPSVMPRDDVKIYVKAFHGNDELMVTSWKTTCDVKDHNCTAHSGEYFTVHPLFCTLTITKSVDSEKLKLDPNQSFIFNFKRDGNAVAETIGGRVTVQGNGSVTIKGLPTGTYSVTEETGWSWRYEMTSTADPMKVTANETNHDVKVTVTNTRVHDKWLDGNAVAVNNWNSEGTNVTRKSTRRKEAE